MFKVITTEITSFYTAGNFFMSRTVHVQVHIHKHVTLTRYIDLFNCRLVIVSFSGIYGRFLQDCSCPNAWVSLTSVYLLKVGCLLFSKSCRISNRACPGFKPKEQAICDKHYTIYSTVHATPLKTLLFSRVLRDSTPRYVGRLVGW